MDFIIENTELYLKVLKGHRKAFISGVFTSGGALMAILNVSNIVWIYFLTGSFLAIGLFCFLSSVSDSLSSIVPFKGENDESE